MNEPMNFPDITLQEVPVTVGDKKYVLREASEHVAVQYRDMVLRAVKFTDGKMSSADGLSAVEPKLVSMCLFDEEGKNVPIPTLLKWKPSIVKALHDRAKEISGLDEKETKEVLEKRKASIEQQLAEIAGEAETAAKNSLGDTGTTT